MYSKTDSLSNISRMRATSNLLVASMYLIVEFQIDVFDVSLFEEIPNRSSF